MRIIAWFGLILYIVSTFFSFLGVLIFDEGNKRAEAFIRLLYSSPLLYFFIKYLF